MEQDVKKLIQDIPLPILHSTSGDCNGCGICYESCPLDAITMIEDENGQPYPKINENRCVRCRMCIRICPLKQL